MDLFVKLYGRDYPFKKFYDSNWLTKSVYSDDNLFLVARDSGKIVGTGSVFFTAGGFSDLIGEFGRLVVNPKSSKKGIGSSINIRLIEEASNIIQYGFAECRAVHSGAQKICERCGFHPTGFEPNKYNFADSRESVVFVTRLFGSALSLRRNNPRVIACIYPIAAKSMQNLGLSTDQIVEDEVDGYPTEKTFETEELQSTGISPLLRIERGRIKNPEVFGNLSLAYGFFKIANNQAHYLVAKEKDITLGAIGFTFDTIDKKVKVLELIEFDDEVKGFLLKKLVKLVTEKYKAQYIEMDVSAYSPRIQKTLDDLGFIPVAYCPSMVFRGSERLDVVRMAKLNFPPDIDRLILTDKSKDMFDLVMKDLELKKIGMEITDVTRQSDLFKGLSDGELSHLAQICKMVSYPAGKIICKEGEKGNNIFVLAEGKASVVITREKQKKLQIGSISQGEIFGEMAIIEDLPRMASLITDKDSKLVVINRDELDNLMNKHNHIGKVVMYNVAKGISMKLRRSKVPIMDFK
ncbi:MAG: GNAT family N-acetyltransferase [Promethearchaeota archaeon]|jgi:RimJ/RimL family protein N-acetyltransferase